MHYFCDASGMAYGTCVYLRYENNKGEVTVQLVCSKARITPIKSVTIPRLELQAAVLAGEIHTALKRALRIKVAESYFWSDSKIVLCYLKNPEKKFPIYVANRVRKILSSTSADQWHHVRGKNNPADIISRGRSLSLEWFQGPEFLYQNSHDWDLGQVHTNDLEDCESSNVAVVEVQEGSEHPIDRVINYFSSWKKIVRIVAWLRRITGRNKSSGRLSRDEVGAAELAIVKHVQNKHYKDVVQAVESGKDIKRSSDLRGLCPYKDTTGVLCVGGRVEGQHPVIIPGSDPIARAIVMDTHNVGHVGIEWTLSQVRAKYWITKGRSVTKSTLKDCVICKRLYGKAMQQKMADLPGVRIKCTGRPFTNIGIDMFGPFLVTQRRSQLKRYVCIYTCMGMRAVHLEMVESLDTNSFINSFRRFVARRGKPTTVYSDNGTNFVGGQRELDAAHNGLSEELMKNYASKNDIGWHFNPPYASHHGGVWERMIRSVRRIMASMLKDRLSDETLHTILCEVEFIINNRPLTKLSDDPLDLNPLTPNHLLMMGGSCTIPPGEFGLKDSYRHRWRYVQHITDIFWKRFVKEYLPELQKRTKWDREEYNLKVGDLVLLMDMQKSRNCWPLAVVLEVHQGQDGLVRSAKVKTSETELLRPISKMVMLEAS
jgi:hypothetical protein